MIKRTLLSLAVLLLFSHSHANAGLFGFFSSEPVNIKVLEAVQSGDINSVAKALSEGNPINAINGHKSTALIEAAKNGRQDMVNLLIKNGADVNAADNYGRTALHYSAKKGNVNIAKTLVKNGADISIKDKFGMTATKEAAAAKNVNLIKAIDPTAITAVSSDASLSAIVAAGAAAGGGGVSTTAIVTGAGVAAAAGGVAAAAGGGGGGGGSSSGGSSPDPTPPSGGGGGGDSSPGGSTPTPPAPIPNYPTPIGSDTIILPAAPKSDSAASYETAEYGNQYGLGMINASAAYARGYTGYEVENDRTTITTDKILVAVVDNGVDATNPDLATSVSPHSKGFTSGSGDSSLPLPGDFHGTHVAGIIAASKDGNGDPNDMHGVAYNAEILAIKSGSGSNLFTQDIADGIEYAVNYDGTALHSGAKVINNSWSYGTATDAFTQGGLNPNYSVIAAIEKAIEKDAIIVFAAGNYSGSSVDVMAGLPWHFPDFIGNYLAVVSVDGSYSTNFPSGGRSNYCGVAKSWCLAAPGSNINSTNEGGGYLTISGTSMAAPHVSGAAAVLLGAFPHLTPKEVVEIILKTADKSFSGYDEDIYGQGVLDLDKATEPSGSVVIPLYAHASGSSASLDISSISTSAAFGDAFSSSGLSFAVLDDYKRAYNIDIGKVANTSNMFSSFDSQFEDFARPMIENEANLGNNISFGFSNYTVREADTPDDEAEQTTRFSFNFGSDKVAARFNHNIPMDRAFSPEILSQEPLSNSITQSSILGFVQNGSSYLTAFNNDNNSVRMGSFYGDNDGDSVYGSVSDLTYNKDEAAFGLQIGMMNEENRFLGSKTEGAFALGDNTTTWFYKLFGKKQLSDKISLSGAYEYGVSFADIADESLFTDISKIGSSSFNLAITKQQAFSKADSLSFKVAQPLRVDSGSAQIDLPIGRNISGDIFRNSYNLGLTPTGREIDLSVYYQINGSGRNSFDIEAMHRIQPGHERDANADNVLLMKYNFSF